MALSEAVKEITWLKQLAIDLGLEQEHAIEVKEDNIGCIALANNHMTKKRTKHIDIRHHHIRDRIDDGTVYLTYCRTDIMIADLMTKNLGTTRFCELRKKLLNQRPNY